MFAFSNDSGRPEKSSMGHHPRRRKPVAWCYMLCCLIRRYWSLTSPHCCTPFKGSCLSPLRTQSLRARLCHCLLLPRVALDYAQSGMTDQLLLTRRIRNIGSRWGGTVLQPPAIYWLQTKAEAARTSTDSSAFADQNDLLAQRDPHTCPGSVP